MSTSVPNPPKGLFAHIQANNLKSLLLFVWFVVLLQLMQIAVMIFFVSVGGKLERTYRGDAVDVPANAVLMHRCGKNSIRTKEYCNRRSVPLSFPEFLYKKLANQTQLFQGQSLYILVPASLYVIFGLWFHSTLTRRQTGAIRVSRQEEPRLHGLIEPLAIGRGLPVPNIEVIESPGLNAYASGFRPANASIGVSRGLINALNDVELEAVLAHEFAHIENRDNRMMTIANLCAGAVQPIGNKIKSAIQQRSLALVAIFAISVSIVPWQSAVLFYATLGLTWLLAESVKHLISRKREFIADARAIEIVKEPAALMSALQKIAGNDRIDGLHPSVQAMMISNLSGEDRSTHPSIQERIAAISATTNTTLAEALQASQRTNRDRWAGQREDEPANRVHAPSTGNNRLAARAASRRAGDQSTASHPLHADASTAEASTSSVSLRQAVFASPSTPTSPQWTTEELRSEQLLQKLEAVDRNAKKVIKGTFSAGLLFYISLPFIAIPLVILYLFASWLGWLMLPIAGVVAWKIWKRHERNQRLSAVLEAH